MGPEVDEPVGPAIHRDAVLGGAEHDTILTDPWVPGWSGPRADTVAKDGPGGGIRQAEPVQAVPGACGLPVSSTRCYSDSAQPGLVRGYHVYSAGLRVRVLDGSDGLVQPMCAGLAVVQHAGLGVLRGCTGGSSPELRAAGDLQYRSG